MNLIKIINNFDTTLTNPLDKAQMVLASLPNADIISATNLGTTTISKLKSHPDRLSHTRYATIQTLADYYDTIVLALSKHGQQN